MSNELNLSSKRLSYCLLFLLIVGQLDFVLVKKNIFFESTIFLCTCTYRLK